MDDFPTPHVAPVPLPFVQESNLPCTLPPTDFVTLGLVLLPDGIRLELSKPDVLVGRHNDADVRLPLPDVSRRHCRFLFTMSGWQILDLNSLNGIFVNGKRVAHASVRHGDRLRIGGFTFGVELLPKLRAADPVTSLERTPPSNESTSRRAS